MLDAFPAVAYLKTIIQALHHYIITIWAGRNAALCAQNQDTTKLVVHDIRRLREGCLSLTPRRTG